MDPAQARSIGEKVEATGRAFIDAPTSGGSARAAEGAMTLLTSGREAAMKRAEPIFEAIASKVYRLGDEPGAGSAFKMINQLLAGVHIAAACEAIAFAKKLGLDLAKVYEVITASAGNSWMFENRVPHILDNDYTPKSAVAIFTKDLGIVSDMARAASFPTPVAASALQMFLMTAASGMGHDDDASVARLYAKIAGIELDRGRTLAVPRQTKSYRQGRSGQLKSQFARDPDCETRAPFRSAHCHAFLQCDVAEGRPRTRTRLPYATSLRWDVVHWKAT